jgi:predicted acetyltransferase
MPVAIKELRASSGAEYDWFVDTYQQWLRELSDDPAIQAVEAAREVYALCVINRQRIFLIQQGVNLVGFAIMEFAQSSPLSAGRLQSNSDYRLVDFYVDAAARRLGVGAEAARLLCLRFRGQWEISALDNDQEAIRFWRVIPLRLSGAEPSEQRAAGRWILRFRS